MKIWPVRILVITLLPLTLLISGCGVGTQSQASADLASAAIQGKLLGGRNPISGATLSIYAVGNSGYGSAATQIGSSITSNADGSFQFPSGTLSSCASSTPNAPIYLLSAGGNTGSGAPNSAAVLGVSLGTCGNFAPDLYVNEITTTALAFAMSHFFSASSGSVTDTFGGPAGTGSYAPYAFGLGLAAAHTIPTIVNPATGTVTANSSLLSVESAKIYSIGNALAACVDTAGPTSTLCTDLFADTTPPGSTNMPTDTLQAAVNIALYPYQHVSDIYKLSPATGAPYVGLTTAPNDWTIGVSYTSPAFGLELNAQTVSTIDIDAAGKVWFPSNAAGAVGIGNFDPSAGAFNGPYTAAGMVHPQQLAVDNTNSVWVEDNGSSNVYGFSAFNAAGLTPSVYTLANTVSTAISINDSNAIDVAVQNTSSGAYYLAQVANYTYTELGTTDAPLSIQSLTSDDSGNNAVAMISPSTPTPAIDIFLGSSDTFASALAAGTYTDNPGQIIFGGTGLYLTALPQSGPSDTHDSICFLTKRACYALSTTQALSPYGMAIDGDKNLWLANAANTLNANGSSNAAYAGASTVPYVSGGTYGGSSTAAINAYAYFHGTGNGGTATTPYGIAIDNSGNVWMSNVGCVITAPATSCTPGSFVLTELIGAAAPTITPVSTTVVGDTGPGNRP